MSCETRDGVPRAVVLSFNTDSGPHSWAGRSGGGEAPEFAFLIRPQVMLVQEATP